MMNVTNNSNESYNNFISCQNNTDYACNNVSRIQDTVINDELIHNCRYYLEGMALTPISVFGMLGRYTNHVLFSLNSL